MKFIRIAGWVLAAAFLAALNVASAEDRTRTELIVPDRSAPALDVAEGAWRVEVAAGDLQVRDRDDAAWRPVRNGEVVAAGVSLRSGDDGWAVLGRGKDRIAVSAKTTMALPKNPKTDMTRILQSIGSMLFQVERKPGRRFEVETPFLVAGVKGTTFGVNVDDEGASVSVSEGVVGVSSRGGGARADVSAGRTATVSARAGGGVSVGPSPGRRSQEKGPSTQKGRLSGSPGADQGANHNGGGRNGGDGGGVRNDTSPGSGGRGASSSAGGGSRGSSSSAGGGGRGASSSAGGGGRGASSAGAGNSSNAAGKGKGGGKK